MGKAIYVKAKGTSSICYRCGKDMKKLSYHRLWCPYRDYEMDRDDLGSINMRCLQLALIAPERDEDVNSVMGR